MLRSLPSWLDHAAAHVNTALLVLGDAALDALPAGGAVDAAAAVDAAGQVGDVAAQAADKNGGFFGVFSSVFETFLKSLDGGLHGAGIPYSYGFSIILLTLLVKLATFPLTKKQVGGAYQGGSVCMRDGCFPAALRQPCEPEMPPLVDGSTHVPTWPAAGGVDHGDAGAAAAREGAAGQARRRRRAPAGMPRRSDAAGWVVWLRWAWHRK